VPLLSGDTVGTLLAASGVLAGVGDGRPEKGKLAFGRFKFVQKERFDALAAAIGARAEQEAAICDPRAYDEDTRDLLDWFSAEAKRRGFKVA
jgi:hypothetical protein